MGNPGGNREKILRCARDLFYHRGYPSTSVDDIIKRCGVAKSNFYYHFQSKEQLALEVLEQRIAELERLIVQSLVNRELRPAERLDTFLMQMGQAQEEVQKMGGCPFGNFAAALPTTEADERAERFRLHLSALFRRLEVAVGDCMAEGVAQGEFRGDVTPGAMAAFVVATLQGLLVLTKTHRDMEPLWSGFGVVRQLLRALPGENETKQSVTPSNR